ncbi:MAG: NADH-quinone oxidoreductase subunit NuoG [bacterium]
MADLVTLTIDGQTVQAPKGTLLIEACAGIGTYVPRFCYHEHLVPYAGCRMCLVDVEKAPKLATACSTPVGEGMVVHTDNEKVRLAREGVLEFILVSHPLDCPVCDKGGECDLQDQTFLYGRPDSRVVDVKRFKHDYDLSSTIKLDYNRCILCKRCVRFTEEIGDDDRLIFRDRGASTEISTQTGAPFNSRFGGTVIEYCPVGALTDQVFRFRARPWELKLKNSTCGECSMGCASELHVRSNNVVRIFNREKHDLNGFYICDKGRFSHEFKDHPERVTRPLLRKGNRLETVSWTEALQWAGQQLKRIAQDDPHAVAGLIGAQRSLEDLANFQGLLAGVNVPSVDVYPSIPVTHPQAAFFLRRLVPFEQAIASKNLVLFDSHLFDELPMVALRIKQSRDGLVAAWGPKNVSHVSSVAAIRTYQSRYPWVDEGLVPRHAHCAFIIAVANDLAGRVKLPNDLAATLKQATESTSASGITLDPMVVSEFAKSLWTEDAVLVIGHQPLMQDPALLERLELLVRVRETARNKPLGLLLGAPSANSIGALALGVLPRADKRGPVGKDAAAIAEAAQHRDLRALILAEAELQYRISPDLVEALGRLECLIVSTFFLDDIAAHAHLVLPAVSWYEATGHTVNAEGRIQELTRGTTPPAGDFRTIAQWTADLGLVCGLSLPVTTAAQLETLAIVPALREIADVTATRDGWIKVGGTDGPPSSCRATSGEQPRADQMRLLVRRPFWAPGSRLDHSPEVGQLIAPWQARMNPADAKRLGVANGDTLLVATAAGQVNVPVVITRGIPLGYLDVEEGHPDGHLAVLGPAANGIWTVSVDKASVARPVEVPA